CDVREAVVTGRVKVEHDLVRALQLARRAEEGVQLDTGLVGQVDQRGGLVADHLAQLAAGLLDLHPAHPRREIARDVLLEDALATDPVRVTRHHQRPVAQVGQDAARHVPVVPDELTLGDLRIVEQQLAGVGQLDRDARDGHALGLPGAHDLGPALRGISRTTSRGPLSSRSPWNRGWRSSPAGVHSLNPTSPTSRGSTQCTPDTERGSGPPSNGERGRSMAASRSCRLRSSWLVKPVPTLPAYTSRPPGS